MLKVEIEKEKQTNMNLFKDDKIDNLTKIMQEQTLKIDKLLKKSDEQTKENGKINEKLDNIKDTLDGVTENFVPETENDEKNDIFILVKNPGKYMGQRYHAIRCMKETRLTQIRDYLRSEIDKYNIGKRPNNQIIFENINIENYIVIEIKNPNAKNLWHRIKESKNIKEKIRFMKNEMIKRDTKEITEEEIKMELLKINEDKKQAMENI